MHNTKNLIFLSISALLAAFVTLIFNKFMPLGDLPAYLLSAFLTGSFMLLAQNFATASQTGDRSTSTRNSVKSPPKATTKGNRESGVVKWFDGNKGYGFITRSMGEDIFVHFRSIQGNGYRSLYEGQSVEFLVTKGDKGPQAEDIQIIK
ncbi:MAG: cold shock domain-containing protein [Gammaproteobacteria bacterium]|nr:cold shock domain-containing protein [Gammaproteobacteria bacterium]